MEEEVGGGCKRMHLCIKNRYNLISPNFEGCNDEVREGIDRPPEMKTIELSDDLRYTYLIVFSRLGHFFCYCCLLFCYSCERLILCSVEGTPLEWKNYSTRHEFRVLISTSPVKCTSWVIRSVVNTFCFNS